MTEKHAGNENGRDAFVFLHTQAHMHDDISVALTAGIKRLDQVELALFWWLLMSQAFLGGSEPKLLKKANSKVFLTGLYTLKLPDSLCLVCVYILNSLNLVQKG